MARKTKLKNFTADEREIAYGWFAENKGSLPSEVLTIFEHYQAIENELKNSGKKYSFVLTNVSATA